MEKVIMIFPPRVRELLLYFLSITNPIRSIKKIRKINKISKGAIAHNWGNLNADLDKWVKAFCKLSLYSKSGYDIATSFFQDDIDIIKLEDHCRNQPKNEAIVICVVKNDVRKIKEFYQHYRNLGVKKFAMLDNDSTDGTFDWLIKQEDTDLFKTTIPYSTNRRQAWINKIVSYYGFNKWYLIVDSDELLMYEDMENRSLSELIDFAALNKISRVRTLTVDMYSNQLFKEENNNDEEYVSKYIYFDSNNYRECKRYSFHHVEGGMRVRMFKGENSRFAPYLTKYPLMFFESGDIQYNSHFSFPFYKNFKSPCWGALFHYKFLSSDMQKYKEIAESGSFYGGSYEYKQYIRIYQENPNMSFIHSNSEKYTDSSSLRAIDNIDKIGW